MTLVLILSAGLVILMALVEWFNFRRTRRLTFLTAAHGLIAIGYCLPPFLIAFLPGTAWESGPRGAKDPNPWGTRLYLLDLTDHLRLPEGAYLTMSIILVGAYAAMVAGYFAAGRLPVRRLVASEISRRFLISGALCFGVIALAALALYSTQFKSLFWFIVQGSWIREGIMSVKWGFLQVLVQVGFPAFLMLVASALRTTGTTRLLLIAGAVAVWGVVFLRLLHVGGRLELGTFILTPLLACLFMTRNTRKAIIGIGVIGVLAVFLANLPHRAYFHPHEIIDDVFVSFWRNSINHLIFILSELGFPHIVATQAITLVPGEIGHRYFIDIPLGALYMLPNFTGVETLPPMILSLQAKLLPWMPVDLFSFGYYSLGTVGVLIIFAGFGAVLAVFDGWLTESDGWLGQALRAAWLFYLPFRLFYADPYAAAQWGFGLIVGTLFILAAAMLSRRRAS